MVHRGDGHGLAFLRERGALRFGRDGRAFRSKAERDGNFWRLGGVKTLISNAGIAGLYTVLARSDTGDDEDALSMFLVIVAFQPPVYRVTRTITVVASPAGVVKRVGSPNANRTTSNRSSSARTCGRRNPSRCNSSHGPQ